MMLHTKYQGSWSCGFREEDFFMFPYISLRRCDNEQLYQVVGNTVFGGCDLLIHTHKQLSSEVRRNLENWMQKSID